MDDMGPDDEALRRPIRGAFVLVKDNLERVMAANIGWSIQLCPALAALAFPTLPAIVRVLLILYSSVMLAPASGMLFVWMARVSRGEMLGLDMLKEDFRELALRGLLCLAPLFGCVGICYMAIVLLSVLHILLLDVLARFALIVLLMCAVYWGPLFAVYPERSPFFLLQQSLLLLWRYPVATVLTALIAVLVAALGVVSIAGFFLIAPVVVALLLTRRCGILLAR
jgi:hypothetical protein